MQDSNQQALLIHGLTTKLAALELEIRRLRIRMTELEKKIPSWIKEE